MLKVLFIFTFGNVLYGQVGPYFGGPTCETAVPIEIGEGYITNDFLGDDWYYFVAPCDGELEVTNCAYGDNKQTIIYSGSCVSLVTEKTATGDDCSTNDLDGGHIMSAGDTAFIQMDDTWDEDDIVFDIVFENPECTSPTAGSCYAVTPNEIVLSWVAGDAEVGWLVIYGISGFDPNIEGDTVESVFLTVTLTDLEEDTCYDFYVASTCEPDMVSCLYGPFTCCTPEACGTPTSVIPISITSESFSLNWTGYFEEVEYFEVEWGLEGFEPGSGTSMECYPFETCDFTDLESYECYDIYARSHCAGDLVSSWSGPFTVCTLVDSADFDIEGTVYFDENENGVQDEGEPGVNLASIISDPESLLCFTGEDGFYATSTLYLEEGVYEISPMWADSWSISSDSLIYTINVDDTYEPRDSLDFGLYPDTLIYDIDTDIDGAWPRCNDIINYWLEIENTGTTIASGLVHLELDDSLEYVSASILPDSIVGQNVYWYYEGLFYFDDELITVQVGTPDGVADTVLSTLTVTIDTGGVELYSFVETEQQVIRCAYDPNDKAVDPAGEGEMGNVPPTTESLEYLVRFQNTGTDTAISVVIRDQLDPNIIWHSLTPLAHSHDMTVELGFDGEVSFIFNDIMLPDSNVNEPASHGFVKYGVKLKEDLPIGTSIYNTAHIYFDFNPAIVTNTTVNTLHIDDVSIAELTKEHEILVYPNPFSESTTIYVDESLSKNSSLQIVDLFGKQVYSIDRIKSNSIEIEASQFSSGLYILVIQDLTTSEIYTKRLVVN